MLIDIVSPALAKYGTARQIEYLNAVLEYGSANAAAKVMGINRRTIDRAISVMKRKAIESGDVSVLDHEPKVLLLDIETSPILAHIWSMWQEVRNIDQIIDDWYILSCGYKWLGDTEAPTVLSLRQYRGYRPGVENDKPLLADVHSVLNKADFVITHNGDSFDIKKMNTRFMMNGMLPTTPYRSIDTLKMAKRSFSFTSNKLDYLARVLLGKRKVKNDGLPLWQGVLRGEPAAWDLMEEYNAGDVNLLEEVYLKLRAWDHMHPSIGLNTSADNMHCTVCNSDNVAPTGANVTVGNAGLYNGYECLDCGHQMRGKTNIRTLSQKHAGLVNAK